MAHFIESLESRTFLSADPALAALIAEGKATIAATVSAKKISAANSKIVISDLKTADELKSSAVLLKTLTSDYKKEIAITSKSVVKALALVKKDVNKGIAVARQLGKKPGNAILVTKLTADIAALQSDASTNLSLITTNLSATETTLSTDLGALVAANPTNTQLATDANTTFPANAGPSYKAIADDATTALTTDVDAIIAEAQGLL